MRLISLLSLMLISATANAQVFKCIEKFGKTIYQSSPCKSGAKEQQLDIKSDPAKEAAAENKLEAIQSEYESRKVAQDEKNKELEKQRMEAATLEIARRNAIAQQEQAEAQKRQAEALEQRYNYDNRPFYILPSVRPPRRPASKTPTPYPEPRRPRSTID
ncbi:MAG: DUF4124 domain-containing protein [Methylomonas lenta]|nr:DUF4124 domain-containing protein [Methylomonas lenta]